MKGHCRQIAERMMMAGDNFVESIMEEFGVGKEDAEKVFRIFVKEKIIKLDAFMGRYNLTHGAFWEAGVIKRALALAIEKGV